MYEIWMKSDDKWQKASTSANWQLVAILAVISFIFHQANPSLFIGKGLMKVIHTCNSEEFGW